MEHNRYCYLAVVILAGIDVSLSLTIDLNMTNIAGQNLSNTDKASLIADYFLKHETEAHYVYESIMASRDLAKNISSGKTSATPELLDAISWYVLTSLPDFLRDQIVQGVAGVIVDEIGKAILHTDLKLNSSQPFSDNDIQKIHSEFNYVRALTRSITIAKPLIEQYRQEDDSTIFIILLNKAIEMTALIVSFPTFQTVMDIAVDELSQGFLKSGLPQRIAKEGTGFLNDNSNTLDIVRTVIASSNMERLVARSYIASKPVLDNLYNGDTLFLFATLMSGTGAQQNPAVMYAFKMFEADFIKTYNEQTNGDAASLITDPMNTYVSVFQDMDFLALMPTIIGSASVRQLLPYNSSTAEFPINDVCYQDTVDMLDAAKDGKDWAIQIECRLKVTPKCTPSALHLDLECTPFGLQVNLECTPSGLRVYLESYIRHHAYTPVL